MRIDIAARLKPFVTRAGVALLVPGTTVVARLYPQLVELSDGRQLEVPVQGPVTRFFVQQDLERGEVRAWGVAATGHFSFALVPDETGEVQLCWGKERPTGRLSIPKGARLSLGSHKKLDWDLVQRRHDLTEILPVWYRLGQLTPDQGIVTGDSLFDDLCGAIEACAKLEVSAHLLALFRTGFTDLMVPTASDTLHLGYPKPPLPEGCLPLALLSACHRPLLSLFLRVAEAQVALLPCLPRELVSGRLTGVELPFGTLDMEWTKRKMRRAVVHIAHSGEVAFALHNGLKRFRLRRGLQDRGRVVDGGHPLAVSRREVLFLDRFEK